MPGENESLSGGGDMPWLRVETWDEGKTPGGEESPGENELTRTMRLLGGEELPVAGLGKDRQVGGGTWRGGEGEEEVGGDGPHQGELSSRER